MKNWNDRPSHFRYKWTQGHQGIHIQLISRILELNTTSYHFDFLSLTFLLLSPKMVSGTITMGPAPTSLTLVTLPECDPIDNMAATMEREPPCQCKQCTVPNARTVDPNHHLNRTAEVSPIELTSGFLVHVIQQDSRGLFSRCRDMLYMNKLFASIMYTGSILRVFMLDYLGYSLLCCLKLWCPSMADMCSRFASKQ